MRVRYNLLARDEVIAAAEYYEQQGVGLGERFLTTIDKAVAEISSWPNSWPTSFGGTRRRSLKSPFPYSIFYLVEGGEIVIVAVAHTSRLPDCWISRLR